MHLVKNSSFSELNINAESIDGIDKNPLLSARVITK